MVSHSPADDAAAEAAWYDALRDLLEPAYLAATDPRGQSGFRGDAVRWEPARRPIARAIHRDGTFLDVGCANGLLMESIATWAAEDGVAIEPYGLDLSAKLAALARQRLPQWADRIYAGNVVDWMPPLRFDFVRTDLIFPEARRRWLVERLLREFVAPGGRLIVCSYGSGQTEPVGDLLRAWRFSVAGETSNVNPEGVVNVRVAWIEAAG
jgi:SAM-dependent methyltransferase